jgi:hypothetical protein
MLGRLKSGWRLLGECVFCDAFCLPRVLRKGGCANAHRETESAGTDVDCQDGSRLKRLDRGARHYTRPAVRTKI